MDDDDFIFTIDEILSIWKRLPRVHNTRGWIRKKLTEAEYDKLRNFLGFTIGFWIYSLRRTKKKGRLAISCVNGETQTIVMLLEDFLHDSYLEAREYLRDKYGSYYDFKNKWHKRRNWTYSRNRMT